MTAAPTNIRITKTDIDGWVCRVEWDDAGGSNTKSVTIYDSTGQWAQSFTASHTLRRAYMSAGSFQMQLKDIWNAVSTKVPFTVPAATQPQAATTLTQEQMLEQTLGVVLDPGDSISYAVAPRVAGSVVVQGAVTPPPPPPPSGQHPAPALLNYLGQARAVCDRLADKADANDSTFYENGIWQRLPVNGDTGGQSQNTLIDHASLSAAIYRHVSQDAKYFTRARDSINTFIDTRAIPITEASDSTWGVGASIGTSLWLLWDQLDAATRTKWANAVIAQADWLKAHGDLQFNTNGNLRIGQALIVWFAAWAATKLGYNRPELWEWYHRTLRFAIQPGQGWDAPWPPYDNLGLRYSVTPTKADGSDGRGYLDETGTALGSQQTGFDPHYTHLQSEWAAQLALVSDDPITQTGVPAGFQSVTWAGAPWDARNEIKHVLNVTLNTVQSRSYIRTDRPEWYMDATGGTRQPDHQLQLYSAAAEVAICRLGRSDLLANVESQWASKLTYVLAGIDPAAGVSRAMSLDVASAVHAIKNPKT